MAASIGTTGRFNSSIGATYLIHDGSITRKDPAGRTVHKISVADYSDHTSALDNPVDGKTYREVATKYDGRGRPVARTSWLVARGTVDLADPPIAGLGSVSAGDGLTEQFLYDDNLSDGEGLDSTTGASLLIGSGNVSLATAIAKLADTEANGGAGIAFDENAPGSARVSISPTGEVSFSIADAVGRTVMSGMIEPPSSSSAGDLITWSCTLHDTTTSLAGFGTVLETRSIDALGNVRKSLTDAAGRTLRSIDALAKATVFTYDAAENQLSVTRF